MTPDDRLDQLEPLMVDSLQKTDRLIEGQGQILEVATRADQKADITAKGLADLTIKVNQIAEGQTYFRNEVRQDIANLQAGQDLILQILRAKLP